MADWFDLWRSVDLSEESGEGVLAANLMTGVLNELEPGAVMDRDPGAGAAREQLDRDLPQSLTPEAVIELFDSHLGCEVEHGFHLGQHVLVSGCLGFEVLNEALQVIAASTPALDVALERRVFRDPHPLQLERLLAIKTHPTDRKLAIGRCRPHRPVLRRPPRRSRGGDGSRSIQACDGCRRREPFLRSESGLGELLVPAPEFVG